MRWQKHGLIFEPAGMYGWMNSHAQVPTALVLDDRIRVYFATRPERTQSLPAYVDLDRSDLSKVLGVSPTPILPLGKPGTFDADGVMPSAVIVDGPHVLLYYSGWCRLGGKAPYNNGTGLAISRDGGTTFERLFDGPILDRTAREPWSATSPAVLRDRAVWHMWYSSGTGWLEVGGKLEHTYLIKHAHSDNGRDWNRENVAIISEKLVHEAQTRPTLAYIRDRWHMWFSYRGSVDFRGSGETYQIGYAYSSDLNTWDRDDLANGIDSSPDGWDSQMVCYPNVISFDNRTIMFYNGNGFGEDGFGYAELLAEKA